MGEIIWREKTKTAEIHVAMTRIVYDSKQTHV